MLKLIKAEKKQTNIDGFETKSFFCSSCDYFSNVKSNIVNLNFIVEHLVGDVIVILNQKKKL